MKQQPTYIKITYKRLKAHKVILEFEPIWIQMNSLNLKMIYFKGEEILFPFNPTSALK
jgi:hypothetical protein